MARPRTISNDAILAAARQVFLAHGYQAPTAEIARLAGVSEGALFQRFRTKAELFVAAMHDAARHDPWHDRLLGGIGGADMRARLEDAAMAMLLRMRVVIPCLAAMGASGVLPTAVRLLRGQTPPPVYTMRVLTRYFKGEIACGRMAMANPRSQAHAFVGALSHYVFCESFCKFRPATPRVYVHAIVDTLLRAAATRDSDAPARSGNKDSHPAGRTAARPSRCQENRRS